MEGLPTHQILNLSRRKSTLTGSWQELALALQPVSKNSNQLMGCASNLCWTLLPFRHLFENTFYRVAACRLLTFPKKKKSEKKKSEKKKKKREREFRVLTRMSQHLKHTFGVISTGSISHKRNWEGLPAGIGAAVAGCYSACHAHVATRWYCGAAARCGPFKSSLRSCRTNPILVDSGSGPWSFWWIFVKSVLLLVRRVRWPGKSPYH